MQYTPEQLEKLHLIEVEILEEVIRICDDNNLRYFTVGGTTLGAIRHDGFIPWDDDIDVGLLREDYEKFLAIAPAQLKPDFCLQHYSVDHRTPTYHAKVMKKGTVFLEHYLSNIKTEHGIFVDIMPFDYIPTNEKAVKKYRKKVLMWHQLYIAKTVCKTSLTSGKVKKVLLTLTRTGLHILLLPFSKEKIYQKLQREITKFNSLQTGYITSRGLRVFECKESDVIPTITHKFERLDVQIPKEFDMILKNQYGNYMQLPPEEKRIGHAPDKIEF